MMKVKKVGIVSLSQGLLGESFICHELELGLKRLRDKGCDVVFMPHAMKGLTYLKAHPEKRAEDLLTAFADPSIDMILCAIGGDDTYRLLPYLFDRGELKQAVRDTIFLGFSDTTINHLMLHKVGLKTFYGQAFLPDVCELSSQMLPYTAHYFDELITTGRIEVIRPAKYWYEEREDFSESGIGVDMANHPNEGFQLLRGAPVFSGEILGGCLDSIFTVFDNSRYPDTVTMIDRYQLFPTPEDWKGKILLLETSEERPTPECFRNMIQALEDFGIFDVISGLLVGKPQNETYFDAYKSVLLETISNKKLSIVYNVNVGHSTPRCIVPFGVMADVNSTEQIIRFNYS
ncbi:LD-carboxypeptidase [Peptoniphilus equinus]|uniref:LD-carboxypeptidase n=1 Tax=Peptoniphilus equinus TaxID=3016343 RepID=A0ABY7QTS9_9FIRM|nr:S66 peptidase family protein [Peptoniphilus equinus]WBW49484.1 LD-carboxypeptidase [Peptoniphilus equinus]